MKIAINGFGRMGRCIARIILAREQAGENIELVGINDIANSQNLAYLFGRDSIHRAPDFRVELESTQEKQINHLIITPHIDSTKNVPKKRIPLFACADPKELDFGALGAEVVVESSGRFLTTDEVAHHLEKGIKKVIISAPAKDSTPTFVLGVNHTQYKGEPIISNASCTTNCLAPIAMLLEREFGIIKASLSTIHSYTNDQQLLDVPHRSDKRRSRAAALNIIPTTTGAAKALYKVLPTLKDKIHGHSLRVPVPDVSMVDLNAYLAKQASAESINALFEEQSKGALKGILGVDKDFGVSSDFLGDSRSSIVAQDLTFSLGNMSKIMAWYDNEWGYSTRIIDMAKFILER